MAEGESVASLPADADSKWQLGYAGGPHWLAGGRCQFKVWAPYGEGVRVEFETEGGEPETLELTREGDIWSGETTSMQPGRRYRLNLGSRWNDCFKSEGDRLIRRDPCARECDFNSTWCILHSPVQKPPPFTAPRFDQLMLYELHIGSFVPAADEARAFAATTERLQHIADLGFNCIQFMPTAEFGGIWGYNSRQLLATHGPWGSSKDCYAMVQKAHELGLAVLFDVVLNHGSSKMNTLWNWDGYGPDNCGGIYFEGEKDTPWGKRFSFHKAEVQDYLKQSCKVWIEEYGVDGLRFDSVHNMPWWLLQQLTHCLKEHYPDKILIAEVTPENPAVINDAGFHSCWLHNTHFDTMKIMKKCDGGEDGGKRLGMLKNMVSPHGFPHIGGVHSIMGSHDQIGDRKDGNQDGHGTHRHFVSRLGGRGNWHAKAQCRALFAFQNCMKGLPMTFMGTEILQEGWWHVDQHHRFDWGLAQSDNADSKGMQRMVTSSNKLRGEKEALHSDSVRFVHEDATNTILGFIRSAGDAACLCVLHLNEAQWDKGDYGIATTWGGGRKWRLVLNTQAEDFGGWAGSATEEATADDSGKIHISVPKWCMLIYEVC